MLGLSREDRIAVLFGSSQKTLPIGVYLATSPEMFGSGSFPFAVFPMLMFHATQLFVDTIIADRIAASAPGEERRDPETDGPVRDPVDATGG
jgi:predicted Na+-dependent transporter